MTSEVTSPFSVFYDRSGQPLDAGYVYIGTAGINPEVSPITAYWDAGLTATAAQPIRTLAGYPSRSGSPSKIFVNVASYSIVVRDRNGALVYSNLNITVPGADSRLFIVNDYGADPTGVADATAAIQAASAALEAAGAGTLWFTPGGTYKVYPDASNTSSLGDLDDCDGVNLAFNGCAFTIARAFTGTQIIFPWLLTNINGLTVGDHTVTCAQLDPPADSLNRGVWWMALTKCVGVQGGNMTLNGGRIALDLVRGDNDLTNQCRSVHFQSITTNWVFYPFSCRNTGIDASVDRIDCSNGGRPFIGYGFRNVRVGEYHTENMTTASIVTANSTGSTVAQNDPDTIGFSTKFFVRTPTPGTGIGQLFDFGVRGTAPCTLNDITVEFADIVFTGANGSEQLVVWNKRSDDSTPDSTVRGHTVNNINILGSCSGFNPAVNAVPLNLAGTPTTTGSYTGENVTNWKIAISGLDATAAHYILGDFGAFKGGLDLSGMNFSGWQKWLGNRPKEGAAPNLLYNGNFNVRQLGDTFNSGTTPANNDDTLLYDGMILLSDGNNTVDTLYTSANAPADTLGILRMQIVTANRKFGAVFPLEQRDCIGAIGEQVCASVRVRRGFNVTLVSFKMAIISWSGTADTITSDIVSAWGAAGTAPTLAANWTYETSVTNSAASQTLDTTFTTYCVTGAIDTASAKQFALFVWVDDPNATVGDRLEIVDAMLQPGWMTTAYPVGDYQGQLARCRRMLRRSAYNVPATTAQNLATIDMRITPTITGGGAGFDSTGTTADTLIAFQTGAAVQTLTLDAGL